MPPNNDAPRDYEVRQQVIYEFVSKWVVLFFTVAQGLILTGVVWMVSTTLTTKGRADRLEDRAANIERRQVEGDVRAEKMDDRLRSVERDSFGRSLR